MTEPRPYQVRWILLLRDQHKGGLFGTTTHEGATPAAAAMASADAVLRSVNCGSPPQELHVLGVFDESDGVANLLSDNDLQAAVRYHPKRLPCAIAFRPL
jgi:hypothetical protein